MKKLLKKMLNARNKNLLQDFDQTDFGEYLQPEDVKKIDFSLRKQDKLVTLRVSAELLSTLKNAAFKHKTKYQKLMRLILEKNVALYL